VGGELRGEAPNGPRNTPYGAIGVSAFTDDQGKGFSIVVQLEEG
jgi:hypothetical protein